MAKNVAEEIEEEIAEEVIEDEEVFEKPKAVYHDEIIAVVSIAAAILLIMSNFNMSGKVQLLEQIFFLDYRLNL